MKSWNGFTCSSTSYSNQQLHNNPLNRDKGVILEGMDKEHCPALSIPCFIQTNPTTAGNKRLFPRIIPRKFGYAAIREKRKKPTDFPKFWDLQTPSTRRRKHPCSDETWQNVQENVHVDKSLSGSVLG